MIVRAAAIFTALGLVVVLTIVIRHFVFKLSPHQYDQTQEALDHHGLALLETLQKHVDFLTRDIGPRNRAYFPLHLEQAAQFIERTLEGHGYTVNNQTITEDLRPSRNVWVRKRGRVAETIVVGAHYDSYGDSPGADDNASGVAMLLAVAAELAKEPTYRSFEFVFFANEEAPDYKTERMGSAVYADQLAEKRLRPIAMVNLESVGYYSNAPGSQSYPFPLGLDARNTGDFVGLVANYGSSSLLQTIGAYFRSNSSFPLEGLALPQWLPGVDWSDQWRFWQRGIPAIMMTDSAFYRYPHYHSTEDTADKLNFDALTRATQGLVGALKNLAAKPITI